ncbi:Thoeris anti-defense Tad2 family protein [Escherichia sp. SP-MK]
MIFAVLKDNGGVAPAQPYQADILANDWMVIK